MKIWKYHPINEIKGQVQYALIITLFFKKPNKRVRKEETGRINICMTLSNDSDDNDIDNADKDE